MANTLRRSEADDSRNALERVVRRRSALMDLALLALKGAEISAFMKQVVVRTRETLEADFCEVFELTADGRSLVLRSSAGLDGKLAGEVTVETGLDSQAGYAMILGEPVHVDDVRTENRLAVSPLLHEHDAASCMTTAIPAHGAVYGLLGVHSASRRRFTEEEAGFLQDVAGAIGWALEHAFSRETARRALDEECRRRGVAEQNRAFLSEVGAALSAARGTASALVTAAQMAVPTLADWCFVDLIEDRAAGGPVVVRAAVAGMSEEPEKSNLADGFRDSYPLDLSAPHGVQKVARTGEPELLPEVGEEALEIIARDERRLTALRRAETKSYLCVPLRAGRRLAGAVGLLSTDPRRCFDPEYVRLASDFACLATLSIADPMPSGTAAGRERTLDYAEGGKGEVITFQVHQESPELLTPRRLEVLRLVAQGLPNKEIARRLHISQNTVDTHAKRIRRALGATSRLEAVQKARDLGLLSP